MSYEVDELFEFREVKGEYFLAKYLKEDDPTVTELDIPAEFHDKPVVAIGNGAFAYSWHLQKVAVSEGIRGIAADAFTGCIGLRSVSLPASLEVIGSFAFCKCMALCEVEFGSYPKFGEAVFRFDPNLPAEITLMGWVRSRDITRPFDNTCLRTEVKMAFDMPKYVPWFCRSDVFSLAAENDCFREIGEDILDELIEYSIKHNKTELTAYFLDLKNRKFGFKKGGDLDL